MSGLSNLPDGMTSSDKRKAFGPYDGPWECGCCGRQTVEKEDELCCGNCYAIVDYLIKNPEIIDDHDESHALILQDLKWHRECPEKLLEETKEIVKDIDW